MTQYAYGIAVTRADVDGDETVEYFSTQDGPAGAGHAVVTPGTYLQGRLKQPSLLALNLWGPQRTRGPREVGHGACVLENTDGALDAYLGYALDGRDMYIWREEVGDASTATVVFRGVLEQPEVTEEEVTLYVRDFAHLFDKELTENEFAGDNALPDGLEGGPELAGRKKPKAYGYCPKVAPPLVNVSRLIYQVHDGLIDDGDDDNIWLGVEPIAVYDKGAALTYGKERSLAEFQAGATSMTATWDTGGADQDQLVVADTTAIGEGRPIYLTWTGADPTTTPQIEQNTYVWPHILSSTRLELYANIDDWALLTNKIDFGSGAGGTTTLWANATPPGHFDWCLNVAGSYFRLGSEPAGQVTADISNIFVGDGDMVTNPSGGAHTLLTVFQALVAEALGAPAFVNIDHDTSITSPYSASVGIWADSEMTYLTALNKIAETLLLGWYYDPAQSGADRFDVYLKQLVDPAGETATLELTETNLLDLKRVVSGDADGGIPAWRCDVRCKNSHAPMTWTDLAGRVALEDAWEFAQEWVTRSEFDADIKTQWKRSPEVVIESYNHNDPSQGSAMQELAGLGLALYGVKRDMFTGSVPMVDAINVLPGTIANVTYPRYALDAGKKFLVIGTQPNYETNMVQLTLWG